MTPQTKSARDRAIARLARSNPEYTSSRPFPRDGGHMVKASPLGPDPEPVIPRPIITVPKSVHQRTTRLRYRVMPGSVLPSDHPRFKSKRNR